jgi:Lhr-like helicase
VRALNNQLYENLYTGFTHFNPIQTQVFHVAYHTDHNLLLGAPTGSGKTAVAEMTVMRVMNACGNAGRFSKGTDAVSCPSLRDSVAICSPSVVDPAPGTCIF